MFRHLCVDVLVLDGVYRCDADGAPIFVEVAVPTDDELHALLPTVIARLLKMLLAPGRAGGIHGPDLPRGAGCQR
jgi:hypothetical protein